MRASSCLIMTKVEPPYSWSLFLYCECVDYMSQKCVMIVLGKDGIARFFSENLCRLVNRLQSKCALAQTAEEKVLISCELCGRELAECRLFKNADGIFSIELSSPEGNVTKDQCTSVSLTTESLLGKMGL